MTREEAIAYGKRCIDLGLNDETQAFCELAIKALEQEPCEDMERKIEKEYLFESLCEDLKKLQAENENLRNALEQEPILDKIRAELHATAEMHTDGDYYIRDEWIDEYFDKYKAESEELGE